MAKYTKIVTDKYDVSLINICHGLLSQVLFALFLAIYKYGVLFVNIWDNLLIQVCMIVFI
jgi:hypothetical protein